MAWLNWRFAFFSFYFKFVYPNLLSVQPAAKYKLHLRYGDGTEGVADVSHLAGRQWDEGDLFFHVKIDPETNALVWNEMLDLDPDSLYLQIKGLPFSPLQPKFVLQNLQAENQKR